MSVYLPPGTSDSDPYFTDTNEYDGEMVHTCPSCRNFFDPEVCWCGDLVKSHNLGSGHSPVEMGCTCSYERGSDEEPTAAQLYEAELHGFIWPADSRDAADYEYEFAHGEILSMWRGYRGLP